MDLVETGVTAFVAFVFIGGSMAYFAGPPSALEEFSPDLGPEPDPCGTSDECRDDRGLEADERQDDGRRERDEDDDDRGGRDGNGKKRGKG